MATTSSTLLATAATKVSTTAAAAATTAIAPQAIVLAGQSPTTYSASNPITLFIIQIAIVVIFCQLLHYPLRLINQPRVIAEVIGGILLGPSVMMRIPGFQDAIFPTASMPIFNAVANLALIIFLFLVGLEVDVRLFLNHWEAAVTVGVASMILPFGLGYAIAWGLYHQFANDPDTVQISFSVFGLFVGTAMAITAFPVLCRILTDLKLLRTNVGVTTLAAGVSNDITGWILLALCVALVSNSSGLAALWALLCVVGWGLLLVFVIRPCFIWLLRRTGSLDNGPTQGMVALTLLLCMVSAWFTGIVGVHPIFGAFLVGVICPHDGGFAIKLTEKIEDLISTILLPLYFALSGLSTNLGLLNDGITWAYVIGLIACALAGKIAGGTIGARLNKLLWRESFSIGILMSCKGLVELIVLNIGFQARILSQRTFTMFVVMALVTTVITTPVTKVLYPKWYQDKVAKWRRGEIDWDGNPTEGSLSRDGSLEKLSTQRVRRLLVYLRLDSLPSLFTFITLLGTETVVPEAGDQDMPQKEGDSSALETRKQPLEVHGLRLIELTQRTSSVMQVTEGEELYSLRDPVVNAFRTFSQLHDVAASGRATVVPVASYAETLMAQAEAVSSDFALIPWGEAGSVTDDEPVAKAETQLDRLKNAAQLQFVSATLERAVRVCNTGVFIDNGFGGVTRTATEKPKPAYAHTGISEHSHFTASPVTDKTHHVFLPFFGGADDRVALRFVLQLARNPLVTASILHVIFPETDDHAAAVVSSESGAAPEISAVDHGKPKLVETVTAHDLALLATLQSSLPDELASRVTFSELSLSADTPQTALTKTLAAARKAVGTTPRNAGDIIVVGRRHVSLGDAASAEAAVSSPSSSPSLSSGSANQDMRRTLGAMAEHLLVQGVKASVLVVQARGDRGE